MNSNWTLMSYRELKKQIKKAVAELGTVLELKGVVASTSKLPLTGNKKGDVYIVSEDNTEYVWTSDNASGLITDYEELGPVISGSFLPPVTETDAGKVATVDENGAWTAVGKDLDLWDLVGTRIQPIPVLYNPNPAPEEFYFETELRPQDIVEGYSLQYVPRDEETEVTLNVPSLQASSYAVAYVYTSGYPWYYGARVSLLLVEVATNVDGPILQSGVFDLSIIGMTGMVGYLMLEPNGGYNVPYRCRLLAWRATESGGGGVNEPFVINITTNSNYALVADKTYSEILYAFESGRELVCVRNGAKYMLSGIAGNGDFTFGAKSDDEGYSSITIMTNDVISAGVNFLLPNEITTNNGKILRGNSRGRFVPSDVNFIVTLTPTSEDYSGTMDKTVAEMTEAYNEGMQIVWRVVMGPNRYVDVKVTAVMVDINYNYPSFNAYVIELGPGVLVYAHIPVTNDGTTQTYSTVIYPLNLPSASGASF